MEEWAVAGLLALEICRLLYTSEDCQAAPPAAITPIGRLTNCGFDYLASERNSLSTDPEDDPWAANGRIGIHSSGQILENPALLRHEIEDSFRPRCRYRSSTATCFSTNMTVPSTDFSYSETESSDQEDETPEPPQQRQSALEIMQIEQEGAHLLGQIGSGLQSQQQHHQGQQHQLVYHQDVQQLADTKVTELSKEIESMKNPMPNYIVEATVKVADTLSQQLLEARQQTEQQLNTGWKQLTSSLAAALLDIIAGQDEKQRELELRQHTREHQFCHRKSEKQARSDWKSSLLRNRDQKTAPGTDEAGVTPFMQDQDLEDAPKTRVPIPQPTVLKDKGIPEPSEQARKLKEQVDKELERTGKEHFGGRKKMGGQEEKEKGKDPVPPPQDKGATSTPPDNSKPKDKQPPPNIEASDSGPPLPPSPPNGSKGSGNGSGRGGNGGGGGDKGHHEGKGKKDSGPPGGRERERKRLAILA